MLGQEKKNLIQCGITSFVSPEIGRYKMTGLEWDVTVVRYDNEKGKGDHRHYPDREEQYVFIDVETMIADFMDDLRGVK